MSAAPCTAQIQRSLHTGDELGTDDWIRVLREARALGAVQLGLSGGEPLLRDDLEQIVSERMRWGSTSISSRPASA